MNAIRTRNGWRAESWVAEELRKRGLAVFNGAPSEPFDLFSVDQLGQIEFWEVKSSRRGSPSDYPLTEAETAFRAFCTVRGWSWHLVKLKTRPGGYTVVSPSDLRVG